MPRLVGVLGQSAGELVGGSAAGVTDAVGRDERARVDEGLGDLDAEAAGEVVVAGAGGSESETTGCPTACWYLAS